MLILRTLTRGGEMHGYEIASSIQQLSADVLRVERGRRRRRPAAHRGSRRGFLPPGTAGIAAGSHRRPAL
jgi:hypothetical protein